MDLPIRQWAALAAAEQEALHVRPVQHEAEARRAAVRAIIERVRNEGDAALFELTERYDGVRIDNLRVVEDEVAAAERELPAAVIAAIDVAIANVRRFHQAQAAGDY